jgi:hypothetical protein
MRGEKKKKKPLSYKSKAAVALINFGRREQKKIFWLLIIEELKRYLKSLKSIVKLRIDLKNYIIKKDIFESSKFY